MNNNMIKLIPDDQKHLARPDNLEIEVLRTKVIFRMLVDDCGSTVQIRKDILRGLVK